MPAGPLRFDATEVREVLRMIESESLDVRAVTMGVSLRDTASEDLERTCGRIYEKLMRVAERLVPTTKAVHDDFAVPITSTRLSVTPLALVTEAARAPRIVPAALALDRAARELGVDYVGGFSALVEKGITPGDRALIDSIPEALAQTERVCSSVNVATTRAGINMDAVLEMGRVIKARRRGAPRRRGGIGCARLVTFANIPDDNPFVAGAMHGVGEGECVINVGCSGPGVVLSALKRLRAAGEPFDVATIAETIKRMAFKVTRAGELIGREVARRLGAAGALRRRRSVAGAHARGRRFGRGDPGGDGDREGGRARIDRRAGDADRRGQEGRRDGVVGGGRAVGRVHPGQRGRRHGRGGARRRAVDRAAREHERRLLGRASTWWRCPATRRPRRSRRSSPTRSRSACSTTRRPACASSRCRARRRASRSIYGGLLGEAYVQPVSRFRADGFVRLGGRIPAPLQALRN